jgi:hypothetical protein
MHKGYTLNYFINFFKSIPDHRWTTGKLQTDGTVQMCALGHCLTNQNSNPKNININDLFPGANAKTEALESFLNDNTAQINDASLFQYRRLGSTPRGRILRALRNRKRTGNILGE